jgi:hypothetical protein
MNSTPTEDLAREPAQSPQANSLGSQLGCSGAGVSR